LHESYQRPVLMWVEKIAMNISNQTYLHGPYGRFLVRVTMVVVLLLACITMLFLLEQRRTQGEMGAILSGFFSDRVLRNIQDQGAGAGREIQIVVVRESQNPWDSEILRRRLLFDRQSSFSQSSRTTQASFFLSNLHSTDIQTEIGLPSGAQSFFISWRELRLDRTKPIDFQTRFPNNFGYFVVSRAGLNLGKTEAILYVDHFCGGLCGSGGYFLMRKLNGVWRVVDQHIVWIS
jgi:hypothetical protein